MIKARASGSKVYLYFMKKGRQARHRIPRNSCFVILFNTTNAFLKIIIRSKRKFETYIPPFFSSSVAPILIIIVKNKFLLMYWLSI